MGSVGDKIRLLREQNHMNHQELAFKVRVGPGTIEKFENGEKIPDVQTILKLSTVLDVPAAELLEQPYVLESAISELIKIIGPVKSKQILNKVKDLTEEDYKELIDWLEDKKTHLRVLQ